LSTSIRRKPIKAILYSIYIQKILALPDQNVKIIIELPSKFYQDISQKPAKRWKMKKFVNSAALLFIYIFIPGALSFGSGSSVRGFMVFMDNMIYNYEIREDQTASLLSKSAMTAPFGSYFTCAGNLYLKDSQKNRLVRYNPDLTESGSAQFFEDTRKFLGTDGKYIFIMERNTLTALGPGLNNVMTVELNREPDTPGYNVLRAVFFDGRAFLFDSDSNLIYYVDYSDIKKPSVKHAAAPAGCEARAMWFEPSDGALCMLLTNTITGNSDDLPSDKTREVTTDSVYTYYFDKPESKPYVKDMYVKKYILRHYFSDEPIEGGNDEKIIKHGETERIFESEAGLQLCQFSATMPRFVRMIDGTKNSNSESYAVMLSRGNFKYLRISKNDPAGFHRVEYNHRMYFLDVDFEDSVLNVYPDEFTSLRKETSLGNRNPQTGLCVLAY
jgi:hypothetical protein